MMYNNQFILPMPDDWKETTVYTFEGPRDNGITQNITMVIDKSVNEDTDLGAYVKGRIESLQQTMPQFEVLSEQSGNIGGNDAIVVTYKYVPGEAVTLYQKQYYIFNRKMLFLFTSTFNKKTLTLWAPLIDGIIAKLKVPDEREVESFFSS
jgi:hypothetical protein